MTKYFIKVTKWLAYLLAALIMVAAILVSVGRLLTPYLNEHRSDFETLASELIKSPVKIQKIRISWNVYVPELTFDQVTILDKDTQKPIFDIQSFKVHLSILQSILEKKPIPSYLKIKGVNITLREEATGAVNVAGFGSFSVTDNLTGGSEEGNKVSAWIFSQPALVLDDIHVRYVPIEGKAKSVTLYRLSLQNTSQKHLLKGELTLNQAISTSLSFTLNWHGDLLDPATISAEAYIYLEALSLPQWLDEQVWKNLQIKQGLGSAKIWLDWNHNQFQKIQSQFQIYQLEWYSFLTKKTEKISRLNGHVGWKKEGDHQIFAGNDILIDLPNHLWPTTNFLVKIPVDSVNLNQPILIQADPLPISVDSLQLDFPNFTHRNLLQAMEDAFKKSSFSSPMMVQVGYMDLSDVKQIALASGLLPEKIRNTLQSLSPKGEIRSLNAVVKDDVQLENNQLSASLVDVGIHAWEKFPGVKHFSGDINWNGQEGDIKLNSAQVEFDAKTLFPKPLEFDQLQGVFHLKNINQNQWLLTGKKIQLLNADLKAEADVSLQGSALSDATIDVKANFSLANMAYISDYFTLKPMDPELNQWLKQAFVGGQLTAGNAIIQGKLSDFPFDNGSGKFFVTGFIKDLEFHFANKWPAITETQGTIVFSGHKMTVDIDSGKILNNPISKVHGEISYIGPAQPQILTVQGIVQGDMSQGLRVIRESPLEKTLGKDLADLTLSGPMSLNLGLTIPLKNPEKAQVVGQVTLTKNQLSLPEWDIRINQLNGVLEFTETDISAKDLQGEFFAKPIKINIQTAHPKNSPSYVNITTDSEIAIADLHQWVAKGPIDDVLKGSTIVQSEINLRSAEDSKPSEMRFSSDLKGVSVNLPEGFGKQADEKTNLLLTVNLIPNKPIETQLVFGKQFSAAATLQKKSSGIQLFSGELRLGNKGQAAIQKQPGILISGEFDTLDWNIIKKYSDNISLPTTTQSPKGFSLIDHIRSMDIRANQVIGLAQKLSRVHLQVTRVDKNWMLNINSGEIAGRVTLPPSPHQPIQAKMQYVYLTPTSGQETLDPKTLPALSFTTNEMRYNGKSLGAVTLSIVPTSGGIAINTLRLDSGFYHFNASGDWRNDQTHLQGTLTSQDVAKFLAVLGSPTSNLVGSSGTGKFDLTWKGAPYNPNLSAITGTASLKLTAGRIINLDQSTNAKMGFGRMLNILSIESLSRRLSLNFSDLFEKGFIFDSMTGNFTLRNGSAFLENAKIIGDVARIELIGRIGLAAKDYNINMTVTPHVTGSIPVVAAIAINPIIGAAVWAVEKIASHAVAGATTHHYTITGPWDNPSWKEK